MLYLFFTYRTAVLDMTMKSDRPNRDNKVEHLTNCIYDIFGQKSPTKQCIREYRDQKHDPAKVDVFN